LNPATASYLVANKVEWVITQFATAKVGLIQVNINPAYRLSEVAHAINCSGCKAVITAERCKTSDYIGCCGVGAGDRWVAAGHLSAGGCRRLNPDPHRARPTCPVFII